MPTAHKRRSPRRTGRPGSNGTAVSTPVEEPGSDVEAQPRRRGPPFLVVAIGASAGGLEAFSALIRVIPPSTNLALVLVQHLAHDQRSILPDLLGNVTKLTVIPASDQLKIEPRHVYVIPPDARMTIADGHLRVRPAAPQREPEGTVDLLFRSMASEYDERAVGVVLSGGAHDGAAGIRQIKAAGGITMAQQPEQAAVAGMPQAAVATGAVDYVLPVEEIARHLTRLAREPFYAVDEAPEGASSDDGSHLEKLFRILRRASGIDFSTYKSATIRRRIDRRMAIKRGTGLRDYVNLIDNDPVEVSRLQEDLLIHVTSFFREPASFAALQERVFPAIFRDRGKDAPVRIWVPGCSTGEEVYSLAIAAVEFLGDRGAVVPLQIFGTDVSEATIEKARAGVYAPDIAADVTPERLRRFFKRSDGDCRITKEIRDLCVFARQDVSRDPPFSKLDLIVCRNLLIYLNQATQRTVLRVFSYALRPDGFLMLGRSETIGAHHPGTFSLFDKKAQIFKRTTDGGRQAMAFSPSAATASTPAAQHVAARAQQMLQPNRWDAQSDANRLLLERYAPPSVIVDEDHRILRSRGSTAGYLEIPSGEFTGDILKMARPDLLGPIRSAFLEARTNGRAVSREKVRFRQDGRSRTVNIHVAPMGRTDARHFLIVFEEQARGARPQTMVAASPRSGTVSSKAALERELLDTRQQLQAIIDDLGASNEELQSANEEVLSSNEELQSTNEELDTAKEELQSTNEELSTLNDELHARNEELSTANSDLVNLLASVKIPIVMVTRDLRIRRFTPASEKILNVIASDVGRPIGHLKPNFVCPDLEELITEAVESVSIREREVEGTDGRVFVLQIRPYTTIDNRIDGAVVALFDISSVEDQAAALEVARATGAALISTVREPIVMLDKGLTVLAVNESFRTKFQVTAAETENQFVYSLGNGQWDIPELRRLLEEVLPEKKNFEGFAVTHDFPTIGRKRMLLDARRIESGRRKQGVVLLVVRDVTDDAS